MNYMGDLHTITSYDGETLYFPDEKQRFLVYGGYGAPPVEYQTRRGYKQDGATVVDYTIAPRPISLELWVKESCSRIAYWQNRAALHDFLRPNRGGAFEFTLTIDDGTKRALQVYPNPGLRFDPDRENNSWNINEPLEFTAYDPIWFNPDTTIIVASASVDDQLVFPIDFPIWFGLGSGVFEQSITYTGTWKTYPSLLVTGPYTLVTIENITTGAAIYLTVAIATGESRIITLDNANISIVDQNGNDKFGELGPDSNLVDFNLRPNPEVPGGVQVLRTTFVEPSITTGFQIAYNERYFAI